MNAAAIRIAPIPASPPAERVLVIALVVALHCVLALAWLMQPQPAAIAVNELSVSVAVRQAEVAQAETRPEPQPEVKRTERPPPKPVMQEVAEAALQPLPIDEAPAAEEAPAVAAAPVVDTEPDYKAAYLNNPRPPYPLVARRKGWEGRVVLNVEVLAEGRAGQVLLQQSCGHEVMDNAALQTVKNWRFVPARHLGQAITQWFLVPIKFSLDS